MIHLQDSLIQPYQKGECLQISNSPNSPDRIVFVVKDAKDQMLPEILKVIPDLVDKSISSTTVGVKGRLHLHDRIVHLGSQVTKYNEEIDNDLCTSILHVILLILTFGGFYYRDSWKLQKPNVPFASLFPATFDREQFKTEYRADQFRALPEGHRKELSSLLKLDETQIDKILKEKFDTGTALAGALTSKGSSSSSSSSSSSATSGGGSNTPLGKEKEKETTSSTSTAAPTAPASKELPALVKALSSRNKEQELGKALAGLSAEALVEQLELQKLTEEEAINGLKRGTPKSVRALLSESLGDVASLLTKEQWSGLPKAVFFLFLLNIVNYKGVKISHLELQECYLKHDPELEKFSSLLEKDGHAASFLDTMLKAKGEVALSSPLAQKIAKLPPAVMEKVLATFMGDSLHPIISATQLQGFSISRLLKLSSSRTHREIFAPLIKETLAKRTMKEWSDALKLGNLQIPKRDNGFGYAGSSNYDQSYYVKSRERFREELPQAVSRAAAEFLPEPLWHQLSLPAFLSFTWAIWETNSMMGISEPGKPQISDKAFREIYLKLDPGYTYLTPLTFRCDTAGLVSRLMPIGLRQLKNLLSELPRQSERLVEAKRDSLLKSGRDNYLIDIASLISRALSAREIEALSGQESNALRALWTQNEHPKPSDPNFVPWLRLLVKEKKGAELFLLASPPADGWKELLAASEPAFLWSLLRAIPYSGTPLETMQQERRDAWRMKALQNTFGQGGLPAHLSDRAFDEAEQDRNPAIRFVCGQIDKEPWEKMIAAASAGDLAWLVRDNHFANAVADDATKSDAFIQRAVAADLATQKKILLAQGFINEALVAALEKGDPELIKLWMAMKEATGESAAPALKQFQNYAHPLISTE